MSNLLQTLSENPTIIIIGVLVLSCILAIPCIFHGKKVKAKQQKFIESHRGDAFLCIFGDKIMIDGKKVSEYECIEYNKDYINVTLEPGEHVISALFSAARKVDRFRPGKVLDVKLSLQGGFQYSIGGYEYSAEQRRNYYKGNVPEHILDLPVGDKYLICYKESSLNSNPRF